MKSIKRFKHEELVNLKNNLNKDELKILINYLTLCSGTASEIKVKQIERILLSIRFISEIPLDKWTLEFLRDYLSVLNKSNLAPATKNDIKKNLRRFLKEYYSNWETKFKKLKDVKLENDMNQERLNANTILTSDDLEKLIRGAESLKLKSLIITLFETGARPTELLSTKWKDIDLEKGEVKLLSTKNKTVRVNTIKESILHLQRYKQEYPFPDVTQNDYVFPAPMDRKEHLSLQYLQQMFGKLTRSVLGKHLFPYILRHTRATELQKKLTAKVYEKVMDHSIEMATRYSHLDKDDVREEMLEKVYHIEELTKKEQKKIDELIRDNNYFKGLLVLSRHSLEEIYKFVLSKQTKEDLERLKKANEQEQKLINKLVELYPEYK